MIINSITELSRIICKYHDLIIGRQVSCNYYRFSSHPIYPILDNKIPLNVLQVLAIV